MTELSQRQRALKEEFERTRGGWSPVWEQVLAVDPDFFESFVTLASVPWRNGTLEPKVREFISIAVNASTTHLHAPGTRTHVQNALRHGATQGEIVEILQLISVLGIHSVTHGVPILVEELEAAGRGAELPKPGAGGEREARLKAEFTAARGYWSELWDNVLALSPDFFEAYMHFSSVPWKHGMLAPKVKEFMYIAIDAATTHLYAPGTRVHIRNAIRYGATQGEIMEVLELASVIGIHSVTHGVPILLEELEAAAKA